MPPDVCAKLREENGLSFDVLSDADFAVLDRYGLAFELPQPVQETFCSIGLDLAEVGGTGHWSVPTPATFVVDRDQRVVFSDVSAEYRRRTDPDLVIAQLD